MHGGPYMTTTIILLGYRWLFESKNMKKVKGKKKSHGIQEFYEEYPSTGGKPMTYNKESQYHKSLATPMTSKPLNSLALSLCPQTRFALLRGLLENSQWHDINSLFQNLKLKWISCSQNQEKPGKDSNIHKIKVTSYNPVPTAYNKLPYHNQKKIPQNIQSPPRIPSLFRTVLVLIVLNLKNSQLPS